MFLHFCNGSCFFFVILLHNPHTEIIYFIHFLRYQQYGSTFKIMTKWFLARQSLHFYEFIMYIMYIIIKHTHCSCNFVFNYQLSRQISLRVINFNLKRISFYTFIHINSTVNNCHPTSTYLQQYRWNEFETIWRRN